MATTVSSTDTQSLLEKINQANATKTSRGTRIVKTGEDMDKNAFLKILSAELSNQDPQNAKDGTEFVAQMAQFAGLEQMANLNSSIRLTGANSLIGKEVTLRKYDQSGNLYSGQVKNVVKSGDEIKINVAVGKEKDANGNIVDKYEEFSLNDVTQIKETSSALNSASNSNNLLNAAAIIGKTVEIDEKDSNDKNYTGVLKGILRYTEGIKVNVQIGEGQTKEFSFDEVIRITES
ncbi:flagellar hook assembly protein FlgD [Clostridium magnum]|uniref:Basal-body rod modification protein FlgD n=1 Tax=Clostridium magnum DSM 2767 TaxID=1121326 RepID=A0A161YSU0_9CLOT|nr:flagellar hook capping FlgD N-terminal domain-containing protein [Clostridium magnum]KZL94142.1 flagellar basal body rod modification protein [Clostridium magnum DSM 2767]SHH94277.1 flagellar basal-body rod modification protein FlgD [Clostridium magnum DSM 2767]